MQPIFITSANSPYDLTTTPDSAQLPVENNYIVLNGSGLVVNLPARANMKGTPIFHFIPLNNATSFTVNLTAGSEDFFAIAGQPGTLSCSGGNSLVLQATMPNVFEAHLATGTSGGG